MERKTKMLLTQNVQMSSQKIQVIYIFTVQILTICPNAHFFLLSVTEIGHYFKYSNETTY